MPTTIAVNKLKLRRRRQTAGESRLLLRSRCSSHSAGALLRVGQIARRVRRQVLHDGPNYACCRLIHERERALIDDLAGVEHVAVPQPAELGAVDLELRGPFVLT